MYTGKCRCGSHSSQNFHTHEGVQDIIQPFFARDTSPDVQQKTNMPFFKPTVSSKIESSLNASKGSGNLLSAATRNSMENTFGTDLSHVRLHTDNAATLMNKDLHAQAFTHGNDIYFNSGKYKPETSEGKHLLAHELTHVVQQQGIASSVQRSPLVNQEVENGVENDQESFSIILARHYLANQRNVPFDPAQTTKCSSYGTNSHECLLVTKSGISIKLMWNTDTNRAIAKAIINKKGLACGFDYSVDDKGQVTFALIKCWTIFDI